MDLLSTFFLVLIVLMSGFIAVLADDLGRRIGKKRIHFRGLRPKRIAQIGTFSAGVIVSLLTIIIVSLGSSGVRQWLLEGNAAIHNLEKARQDLAQVQKSKDQAISATKTANGQRTQALNQYANLKKTSDQLDKDLESKKVEVKRQQTQLAKLNGLIARLNPRITALQKKVSTADARIVGLDKRLAERQQRLHAVEGQLKEAQTQLSTANNDANAIKKKNLELLNDLSELGKERDSLTKSNGELQAQRTQLLADKSQAQSDLATAKSDLEETQTALGNINLQLEQSQTQLHQAQQDFSMLRSITSVARSNPMIYGMGQEVTRLSIPAGQSVVSAENNLASLLRSARVAALKAGAKQNGSIPEAGLFGQGVSEEEVRRDILSKIAGSSDPLVLVAYSVINTFKGEPVALQIVQYPDPIVYKKGEVVVETRIDGRKDSSTIFHQISNLGEQVRDKAKKDKMIPRLGSDELYGAVSSEDVLKLLEQVRATDRQVRVRAVAEDDIRAGDPLKLSFIIR